MLMSSLWENFNNFPLSNRTTIIVRPGESSEEINCPILWSDKSPFESINLNAKEILELYDRVEKLMATIEVTEFTKLEVWKWLNWTKRLSIWIKFKDWRVIDDIFDKVSIFYNSNEMSLLIKYNDLENWKADLNDEESNYFLVELPFIIDSLKCSTGDVLTQKDKAFLSRYVAKFNRIREVVLGWTGEIFPSTKGDVGDVRKDN